MINLKGLRNAVVISYIYISRGQNTIVIMQPIAQYNSIQGKYNLS
jgi:hypothetical protein